MTLIDAVKDGYAKFANFEGRAPRSAFWWWSLYAFGIMIALAIAEGGGYYVVGDGEIAFGVNLGLISGLWLLVHFLPGLAVSARRLHDTDRSGWWLFLMLIPIFGWAVLLFWFASKGTQARSGDNRFGADPLEAEPGITI